MLRKLASVQDASVSDLVREAIDMLIADRMNNRRPSPQERQAAFDAFITKYAGSQPSEPPQRTKRPSMLSWLSTRHDGSRRH